MQRLHPQETQKIVQTNVCYWSSVTRKDNRTWPRRWDYSRRS